MGDFTESIPPSPLHLDRLKDLEKEVRSLKDRISYLEAYAETSQRNIAALQGAAPLSSRELERRDRLNEIVEVLKNVYPVKLPAFVIAETVALAAGTVNGYLDHLVADGRIESEKPDRKSRVYYVIPSDVE